MQSLFHACGVVKLAQSEIGELIALTSRIVTLQLDGSEKICYIAREVIDMAKLSAGAVERLKNMARGLKDDNQPGGVRAVADKFKQQMQPRKKQTTDGTKASGRKD